MGGGASRKQQSVKYFQSSVKRGHFWTWVTLHLADVAFVFEVSLNPCKNVNQSDQYDVFAYLHVMTETSICI